MSLGIAFRAFFAALGNRKVAEQIRSILEPSAQPPALPAATKTVVVDSTKAIVSAPKPPSRSDAVALLATLQREARLIDLIKENLSAYSDAQVGAAARPCLVQCAATLDRIMGLKPIETTSDGQTITVPESATAARYSWIGEGEGATGKLIHHGWEASRVELPSWTGEAGDATVIAPAQVKRA